MTYKVSNKGNFYGFHPYGGATVAHYKNIDSDITKILNFLDSVNPSLLTRTTDTGQYTPGSYTSGMTDDATIGYAIYKFSDGHGDIFLRLNFATGTSRCGYVNIEIGTATNGSGSFVGWSYMVDRALAFPGRDSFYSEHQYISASVKEGLFALRFGHGHSLDTDTAYFQPATFFIARSVDNIGNYLSGEVAIFVGGGYASGIVGAPAYATDIRPAVHSIDLSLSQTYSVFGCPSGLSSSMPSGDYANVAPLFGVPMGSISKVDRSRYYKIQVPFAVLRNIPDVISCYHDSSLGYTITTANGTFKPSGCMKDPLSNFALAFRVS